MRSAMAFAQQRIWLFLLPFAGPVSLLMQTRGCRACLPFRRAGNWVAPGLECRVGTERYLMCGHWPSSGRPESRVSWIRNRRSMPIAAICCLRSTRGRRRVTRNRWPLASRLWNLHRLLVGFASLPFSRQGTLTDSALSHDLYPPFFSFGPETRFGD